MMVAGAPRTAPSRGIRNRPRPVGPGTNPPQPPGLLQGGQSGWLCWRQGPIPVQEAAAPAKGKRRRPQGLRVDEGVAGWLPRAGGWAPAASRGESREASVGLAWGRKPSRHEQPRLAGARLPGRRTLNLPAALGSTSKGDKDHTAVSSLRSEIILHSPLARHQLHS